MMNEQLSRRTMPQRNRRGRYGAIGCDENHTEVEGVTDAVATMSVRICRPDEVAT